MKIVFLGSPEFAIPSLEAIINNRHQLLAVVTQPDAEADRGHKLTPCPLKTYALSKKLKVLEFEKISRDGVDELKALKPDILVTVAYGQILSQEVIDIPRFGTINVHGSLLPKYRGASPIQSAIIEGEKETGISIMKTESGLDTGDVMLVYKTEIGENETAGELSKRLSVIGAEALIEALDLIEKGEAKFVPQESGKATITTKIKKVNSIINFNKTAKQISCLVRGCNPDPVARAILGNDIVKIYEAKPREDIAPTDKPAGTIIAPTSAKTGVFVQCGIGVLEILKMQMPNGKVVDARCLVGGRKISEGMAFGDYMSAQKA